MKTILHYVFIIAGLSLILLGIAGMILPVMPGVIFVVLGLIILGKKSTIERWISKLPRPLNKILKF